MADIQGIDHNSHGLEVALLRSGCKSRTAKGFQQIGLLMF